MVTEIIKGVIQYADGDDPAPVEMATQYGLRAPRYSCMLCGVSFWEGNKAYLHAEWHKIGSND